MQERPRNVQKKLDARAELLFCPLNLLLFFNVLVAPPPRRSFVRSLITQIGHACLVVSM